MIIPDLEGMLSRLELLPGGGTYMFYRENSISAGFFTSERRVGDILLDMKTPEVL
jgi:hypothetical protein